MRALPEPLSAALASGVTTLCRAWRITRPDGLVLGFTEHDRDLVVAGVTYRAASGIAGSETVAAQGLAVTGTEVSGALSDDALAETDLAAGLYDGAWVEMLLVDWSEPESHLLLRRGRLGEIRRADGVFTCEVRGLADALNETRGRRFTGGCDADFGDTRCGVDAADPSYRADALVSAAEGATRLRLSGLSGFEAEWFTRGRIAVLTGAAAGFACEVKAHDVDDDGAIVTLWQRPPLMPIAGDGVRLVAGCDKRFATCRDRFANALNFRGFPHMPGNDFVVSVAVPGEGGYDGSLL